jgi:hypothetical protein
MFIGAASYQAERHTHQHAARRAQNGCTFIVTVLAWLSATLITRPMAGSGARRQKEADYERSGDAVA